MLEVLAAAPGEDAQSLRERAVARAFELGGLAYERRGEDYLESDHLWFECRETTKDRVAVFTPLGVFLLPARRARAGEISSAVRVAAGGRAVGAGVRALEDQTSPPAKIFGRLNPPRRAGDAWTYQPSSFLYEDGTSSDFLGLYPREVRWDGAEPAWGVS